MDSRNTELHNPRKEFKLTKEEQHSKIYFNTINPTTHHLYLNDASIQHDFVEKKLQYVRPISVMSVKDKVPRRLTYIDSFFSNLFQEIYDTLWVTFSFDKIDFNRLQSIVLPLTFASISYGLEEYISSRLGRLVTGSDEFSFVPKLAASLYIFHDTAKHRITDQQIDSVPHFSMTASIELLAILNLYISTYHGSRKILDNTLDNSFSLLISLALSALIVPSLLTSYVQKKEKEILEEEYYAGSQRSATTLVASGFTSVSNTFFQFYALMMKELSVTRAFQLGLIANNILGDIGISRQMRNLPSMLIDVIPQILRKLFVQLKKIEEDYFKNTQKLFTLQLNYFPPKLEEKKLYELKTGDLVWCGKNFDFSCVPVSGEIFSFDRDHNSDFKDSKEPREVRVNLKTYTGENTWIKNHTQKYNINDNHEIDQRAIQDHKQIGILNGAEIDFLGLHANFFVRIARKKEYIGDTAYEKKAVINQIISQYKQNNTMIAFGGSLFVAMMMGGTPVNIFLQTVKLLLSVFQMMIPFSESFLREMVNSKFMKKINYVIPDMPMDMMDALRVTDFWNALSGYYADKFPKGVAIISDKTGTLTTTQMKALGIWTKDMGDVDLNFKKDRNYLHTRDTSKLIDLFEYFAAIYTNNKKELEPEEHAILNLFKHVLHEQKCLKVEALATQHFKKTMTIANSEKIIETYHLGLYTNYGGRFTLCIDEQKKYLLFCGIPRIPKFNDTEILQDYNLMHVRQNVLSRDWCIARTEVTNEWCDNILQAFNQNDTASIEVLLSDDIIKQLKYACTFLINNPVKKGVEQFIPNCKNVGVPVIIATGDTAKASQNIARVLCPNQIENIITLRPTDAKDTLVPYANLDKSTIIFAGINDLFLEQFDRLMMLDTKLRCNIIFAEMTTSDKGRLAAHMKKNGYFVVANGDGTNDIAMMKEADFVLAHLSRDGTYAPYVSQYVNMNDKQVQKLCHKTNSFYELFDIHRLGNSQFILPFIQFSNAQEMVSYALIFKTIKLSMELARSLDYDAVEIFQQQWLSIIFDLSWLWISSKIILNNANLPVHEKHLGKSWLPLQCMFITMSMAVMESLLCYQLLGKTSDFTLLALTLAFLPIGLTSFFRGYKDVQSELKLLDKDEQQILQIKAEKKEAHYPQRNAIKSFSVFREKKPVKIADEEEEKKRCCIIL